MEIYHNYHKEICKVFYHRKYRESKHNVYNNVIPLIKSKDFVVISGHMLGLDLEREEYRVRAVSPCYGDPSLIMFIRLFVCIIVY